MLTWTGSQFGPIRAEVAAEVRPTDTDMPHTVLRHRDLVGRGLWVYVTWSLLLLVAVGLGCGGAINANQSEDVALASRRDYAIFLATCGGMHLEAQERLAASGRQAVQSLLTRIEVGDLARFLSRLLGESGEFDFFRLGNWDVVGTTDWLNAATSDGELAWACVCALIGDRPNFLRRSGELLHSSSQRQMPEWAVRDGTAIGACLAARTRLGSAWVCGFPERRAHLPTGSQPISAAKLRPLLRHPMSAVRWLGLRVARAGSMDTADMLRVLREQYGREGATSLDSPLERWTYPEEYALIELVSEIAREDRKALDFLNELGEKRTSWALAGLRSSRSLRRGAALSENPPTLPSLMLGVRSGSDLLDLLADLDRQPPWQMYPRDDNPWGAGMVLHAAAPLTDAELVFLRRLMQKYGSIWTQWKKRFDCVRLAWLLSESDAADVDRWLRAHWNLVADVFCQRGWDGEEEGLEVANTLAIARVLPPMLGTAILDSIVPRAGGEFQESIEVYLGRNSYGPDIKPLSWPETIGLVIREHGWLRERSWSEQLDFLSSLSAEPELCCVLFGATTPSLRAEARRGGVNLVSWVERVADPAVRAAARAAWGL
jgi:hypothetical protein